MKIGHGLTAKQIPRARVALDRPWCVIVSIPGRLVRFLDRMVAIAIRNH